MSTDQSDPNKAAILEAVTLRFETALAEAEATLMATDTPAEVLHLIPRAASTGQASLPTSIEAEDDVDITMSFEQTDDIIEVQIEVSGFHRIEEMEGRRALMKTRNETVRYEFVFDDEGMARFSLDNRPSVVEALLDGWSITLAPSL